jgi:hypothetical protein
MVNHLRHDRADDRRSDNAQSDGENHPFARFINHFVAIKLALGPSTMQAIKDMIFSCCSPILPKTFDCECRSLSPP